MKSSKLISLMLMATLFIFSSCDRDKDEDPNPNEVYRSFLSKSEPMIMGVLNDTSFNWGVDADYRVMQSGVLVDDSKHSLTFGLINKVSPHNNLVIQTPAFDMGFKILEAPILSQGNKKIGSGSDAFVITYHDTKGNRYTTDVDHDQTGSSLKVLKTERAQNEYNQDVTLAWLVVNCTLYQPNEDNQITLKDARILAAFRDIP